MLALQKKLAYLILGMKGGENRIQIINALNERPYNINQLSQVLDLNYRTIKHHISILHKNEIISSSKAGGYGDVYFLSPKMEGNFETFLEIEKKFENSKKLNEFAESRKYYKDIVEQSNDAIILVDIDERVYFWNKGSEKLFGYKDEKVLGQINPIIPKEKKDEFNKILKKILKGKIITDYETQWINKSGKLIDVSSSISPIRDKEDKLIGISIISRDISERVRHHLEIEKEREKFKRSEERYALAQRAANIGSWDWNITTGDLQWSDTIETLFGFKRGEFSATYEGFLECVHPEDRQFVENSVNNCVEKGKDYDIEHRIIWPNGNVRWVSETGDVIRDKNGNAIRMLGIVRDITERKKARAELIKSQNMLDDIVSAIGAGLNLIDLDRRIIWVNKTFVNLFGSIDEIKGKHCYEIYWGRKELCENCLCDTVVKSGEMKQETQIRTTKDGEKRKFLIACTPIKDENGKVVQVLELVLDISKGFKEVSL